MIKRVIILGNKGFIGRHLQNNLLLSDHSIEVIGKDLPDTDLTNQESVMNHLGHLLGDNTAVIFLAALKRQFGDTREAFNQNLNMTNNFCSLLEKKSVGRFIFFSSSAVYGEGIHNTHITEQTPVCPTSYYGMAKFAAERLLWKALSQHPQSTFAALRPATIYGPGDQGGTYALLRTVSAKAAVILKAGF